MHDTQHKKSTMFEIRVSSLFDRKDTFGIDNEMLVWSDPNSMMNRIANKKPYESLLVVSFSFSVA
jgi:hypothetical protein